MNVLLIAPDFGLPAAQDEVRAVSTSLHPVILSGTVTRHDVLEALRGHAWDVLWLATHGDETGVLLSDGKLTTADLTAVVRASGAYLVVLNSCSSRLVGLELHYELDVAVITTQTDIADVTAYQTGTLLALALGDGYDIHDAYERSRPGQMASYFLFTHKGRDAADETRTILMLNEWGARLSSKIDLMDRRIDHEIGVLRGEINGLVGNVQMAVRLPPWHRTAFVGAFGLLFLPVPMFYSQVRDLLDIGWCAALGVATGSYLLSAVLWSYMWWGGGAE